MLIYCHTITPRLQYIANFLSDYFSVNAKIICDEEKFLATKTDCKINYSFHKITDNEIWIHSHVLLFESSIRPVKVETFEYNGYKAFFKTEGDTGFDLFAAMFFLLTRYEEYLPYKKDMYGRYGHENSLAFKEGFLHLPLINIWLEDFKKLIHQRFPTCELKTQEFKFVPTYDIDMAWSYKNKGFKRNAGGLLNEIVKGKFKAASQRIKVLRKKIADPFDSYDWMTELHQKFNLSPLYFFLVAQENSKYDKNIKPENQEFQKLLQSIAANNKIGLHPSWSSSDQTALLPKEKHILEQIADQKINTSRQHYIRFVLPQTYLKLINAGITNEYSMGYGSINGFRASVATSYYWYDVKADQKTSLMIHPFCFMDANSYYEQKQTPDEALQEMLQYHQVIKQVNGTMITIWHNSFLGTGKEPEGWREAYQKFFETASM